MCRKRDEDENDRLAEREEIGEKSEGGGFFLLTADE